MIKKPTLTEDNEKLRGKLLVDSCPISLQLVEDGRDGGRVIVRGEFARAGQATENKRVYPRDLWEREIARLNTAMVERRVFGELDHPNDGRTQLTRASHLLTGLQVLDDDIVIGEAEALDTARGRDLKAMLQAGAKVGISSRGYGSTRTNPKGEEVVQEDYQLVTFDFVAEPADSTAYPEVFSENKEQSPMAATDAEKAQDQAMAKKFAAKVEQDAKAAEDGDETEESLTAQFESEIMAQLGNLSAESRERIRAELMADPAVGRAKAAIESIKDVLRPFVLPEDAQLVTKQKDEEIGRLKNQIKERDLRLTEAATQIEQLSGLAREAGYKFFLERSLAGNPDKSLIVKVLGDLRQFESADALKAKVAGVLAEMKAQRAKEETIRQEAVAKVVISQRALNEEKAQAAQEKTLLAERVEKMEEALEKSLKANKLMSLELYAERRLASHPQAKRIRKIIEASKLDSKDEIDTLIEEHRESEMDQDDLEATRSRVRAVTRGGRGSTPIVEETPSPITRGVEDYNGLGVDLTTLRQLSGVSRSSNAS